MLSQSTEVMMFDEPIKLRSVLAVLAGYAVTAVIVIVGTIITVQLMMGEISAGSSPQLSSGYLLINLALSFVAAVTGGWITGLVARRSPLVHAGALSCLLLVLSVLMALISLRNPESSGQPGWYPWITGVVGAAGALIGGLMRRGE